MRIIKFIYCLILAGFSTACAHSQHKDGPYVFYLHDTVAIRSVVMKDGKPTMTEQIIINNQPSNIHISIPASETVGNGFELDLVKLQKESCIFEKPKKLFVVSDIEGEFAPFKAMLLANGVIDENYEWTFGEGHLVICGDLFDRGQQVVEYLWLLYKLEQEAKAKGGYVHVILGNHDIMNLSGDFRYVMPKYFETAGAMGIEYKALYADNTELGRWLRTKNIMEKIGDILFLHAGISSEVNNAGLSLQAMNDSSRPFYATHIDSIPDRIFRFYGGDNSPFWYRGYFKSPRATLGQVDSTLSLYGVKQIIVGHTVLSDITQLYGGKVIGIDVNEHAGNAQALLIEEDKYYRVGTKGDRKKLVIEN
jgi:Calcineurin-like phosphoesterase